MAQVIEHLASKNEAFIKNPIIKKKKKKKKQNLTNQTKTPKTK
jgi:hypothetical protein